MDLQYIHFGKHTEVRALLYCTLRTYHMIQGMGHDIFRLHKQDFQDILHLLYILADNLVVYQYNSVYKSM